MTVYRLKELQKAWFYSGLLVFVFAGLIIFPPIALAQSSPDLINRLNRLEREIETLNRAVYRGESPPDMAYSGEASVSANAEVRLQQLETEIRNIRGQIEENAHAVRQMQAQMERMVADMDLRLSELEGNAPRPNVTGSADQTMKTMPVRNASQVADGNAAAAPDQGFQWNSGGSNVAESSAQNSFNQIDSSQNAQLLGTYTEPAAGTPDEYGQNDRAANAYENAFAVLKNGQYDAAESQFRSFLSSYPTHSLASNAQYWLGETYYVRGRYNEAAKIFAEAYQKYPQASKASDNLLKLGLSLAGMGNKDDACIALSQIKTDGANGNGPVLRRTEQEMQRLGC